MYRLYTNPKEKMGHISKELQGHFRSIWEGAFMKAFMWEKIPPSPMKTACGRML